MPFAKQIKYTSDNNYIERYSILSTTLVGTEEQVYDISDTAEFIGAFTTGTTHRVLVKVHYTLPDNGSIKLEFHKEDDLALLPADPAVYKTYWIGYGRGSFTITCEEGIDSNGDVKISITNGGSAMITFQKVAGYKSISNFYKKVSGRIS